MKYILTLIATLAIQTLNLQAQNVGFTYQAVAIDESKAEGFGQDSRGEILVNKNIGLRFSIHQSVSDGQVVYRESHETATDIFGIFRVIIGRGFDVSGSPLSDLEWGDIPYFLEVEVDLGNGFQYLGTEELLGSPYSLNKKQQLVLDGNTLSITNGNHVTLLDNDPANELIQQFLLSGTELTIKDSGGIHTVNLAGLTTLNEAQVDALVSNNGFLTTEIDGSITNELQTLTKSGNEISLSHNGGTVSIEDGDSNDQNEIQDLQLNGTVLSITNNGAATPIDFAGFINNISLTEQQVDDFANNNGYLTAESQDIATNGNPGNISIANGSEINLNVNDADASATNELQALELNGSVLSITNNPSATPVDFADLLAEATLTEQQVDDYVNNNGYLTSETQDISTNGNPGNISIGNGSELNLNVDDDDADATNEIQDLQLTNNTLSITSNANASSIDLEPYLDAAFSTTNGVTSNAPGNYSTDDFVFGSPTLADYGIASHDTRMYFDKSKGSFRAGRAQGNQWNESGSGDFSVAMGQNSSAYGYASVSIGESNQANGSASVALGQSNIANGASSVAVGYSTLTNGSFAFAQGLDSEALGNGSIAMGFNAIASGVASLSLGESTTSTAERTIAFGFGADATGNYSFAAGYNPTASGVHAIAFGFNATASGGASLAIGSNSVATGNGSVSLGTGNFARSFGEMSIGLFNTDVTPIPAIDTWGGSDRLYSIGNGQSASNRSDALVMLKNGNTRLHGQLTIDADNVTGPGLSYTLPGQRGTNGQVMVTDGSGTLTWSSLPLSAFTTNAGVTSNAPGNYATDDFVFGSPSIDDDGDPTHDARMYFDKSKGAFRAGGSQGNQWNDQVTGNYSIAMGQDTRASGYGSVSLGWETASYGLASIAMGASNIAAGEGSVALGVENTASANYSFAAGVSSDATGVASIALGGGTLASGLASIAMGENSTATASHAVALGYGADATGNYSFAGGYNTTASGSSSVAIGFNGIASGTSATSLGNHNFARSFAETSFGLFNTDANPPLSTNAWMGLDRLFVIGNGQNASNRSNALVMLKNGNTTLHGQLTIDADNVGGAGEAYTLPAQDGNANQVMTTDGNGVVSWTTPGNALTETEVDDFVSDNGFLASEVDGSVTNEIQDLALDVNTHMLSITNNASATPINLSSYLNVFARTNDIISNQNGTYASDDFVFGSPQLASDGISEHRRRMFFDKSKSAFRAGFASLTQWDDANVGASSAAFGYNSIASGDYSFAVGLEPSATGHFSAVIGNGTASGSFSRSFGNGTLASGDHSLAAGIGSSASGMYSVGIGSFVIASGTGSYASGIQTLSRSQGETAFGMNNTDYVPLATTAFDLADRLFVVGNGQNTVSRSDALVMLKNGNTRLHGQLTIDADNVNGAGEAYTLPAQDGNANQVMTTDGNGIVSWTTPSNALTETEVDDFVSDNGFLASEVDGSVTNEIQDLSLTNNVLSITNNASATPIDLSVYENVFQTSNGVTSNENGDYTSDDFVFGSPTIDNAIQVNYASRMFFDKSRAAFRAGYVLGNRWNEANIGYASTAFGENTRAAGNRSFATGDNSSTYGENSASIGTGSVAWADRSLVFGTFVQGFSYNEIAIGSYNTSYTVSANGQNSWQPSDRLFVIGNGASGLAGAQSDALIMLKNGNTLLHGQLTIDADNVGGAGLSYTLPGQRGSNGQVMTTDGSGMVSWTSIPLSTFATNASVTSNANGNYAADDFVFGSPQLANSGNAIHNTRMFFDKSKGAFRAGNESGGGWNDANVGANSAAFGLSVTATGNSSFAAGAGVNAMGASAIAMGSNSNAFDQESVALGNSAHAYETRAFAIGSLVDAIGQNSFAIGYNVEASSYGETAMGINGLQWGGSTNSFVPSDRLFSVGNGIDENNRSDAFVIYKNGDATLTGLLTQLSDAKLKKSVCSLKGSLSKLSLVRGVNYQWNGKRPQDTLALQTGFIAQEIETVFPELVQTDAQGFKSVNYIGLIPHLVEAIKALRKENEELKNENNQMKDSLKVSLLLMDAKITALEGLLTQASTAKK